MPTPPYPEPPNEPARQAALRRYQILDTPPEENFDRLTRLAARLFDVPVALVSLLDGDRQWHKSCYGYDARAIDREVSFCTHTILDDDLMVVNDATADPRFAANPLVTADPTIRFYAGAPLVTPDGHALGSLCIIDTEPRTLAEAERSQLWDLAHMVMDELELRREVANRKAMGAVQATQNAILERVVGGAPLDDVLAETARFVEDVIDGARVSVLLLDEANETLRAGVAPSLPDDFLDAADGTPIAPGVGSCARAAFHDTEIVTHDIASDPHWEEARAWALAHDLRGCWSIPIRGEGEALLGTLAVYFALPHTPDSAEQAFARQGAHLAGVAIERDRAHYALQESESKFRSLVENTNDWVWEIDAAGRFTYASPAVQDVLGYAPEAVIGKTTSDFMAGEEAARFQAELASYVAAREPFDRLEQRLQHRDGHDVVFETSATPRFDASGAFVGYRGIARNITNRRAAQDALEASEQRFRGLVSNLPGLVYRCTYDAAWTTLYMSRGLDDIGGYAVSTFDQGRRSFKEIVVPDDLPMIRAAAREAVETRSHFEVEYRIRAKDGSIRWIEDVARPCFDEAGRVKWLDGVMFDVTERKQTEERLRLLETAVTDATESVLITDNELDRPGPRIVYANPGFEAMTGYAPEAVIGKTPRLLQGPDTDEALLRELRGLLENGEAFFGETINYRKDGTPFVNEWSISPVSDEHGAVTHYVAVQRDITERKRMEKQLLQIRTAVENMSSAVGITDADGRPLYLNAAGQELLGYTPDELDDAGGPPAIFADPDEGEAVMTALYAGTPWQGEAQVVSKGGRAFPAMMRADAVVDETGTMVGMVASIDDISERREIENKLERYFDVTLDMLMFCALDGTVQHVNRQFYEALGYDSAEAMVGHHFDEFLHPDDEAVSSANMERLLDGKTVVDFINRYRHQDGTYRMLEWRAVPSEEGVIYAAARDVTEREKTKKELVRYAERLEATTAALEEAKARTDRILASITDAFFTLDHNWQFTFVNDQAEQLLEHAADELIGATIWDLFPDAVGTAFHDNYKRAVEEGASVEFEAFYASHGRWYKVHAYPFEDGLSVFFSNVTDKKRAERALRESEEKYRTVVENVKDVVFRTDARGQITFLNPAWTEVTGHPVEAALGRPLDAFAYLPDEADAEVDWSKFDALLDGGRSSVRYELQLNTPEGTPRWMEIFARPMFDERGQVTGTSGTLHDVTKWREAEQQMRVALEKERELGRLKSRFVSMASHELRTPLATIQSSAELADLFMRRDAEEKTTKHLQRIQRNVDRMTTLLEDVLIFGRVESGRLPFEPIEMDAAGLARKLATDVRQGIGADHALQTTGLDDEIALEADPQLLRLIITNLLSNAVKYSPEGSTVSLDVRHSPDTVRITVADEGIGIPDDELDRLFEPFHRAENVGTASGTGLGLSILKEATDLHQGTVEVDSTEGEGTTFWVTLPRTRPAEDATEDAAEAATSAPPRARRPTPDDA